VKFQRMHVFIKTRSTVKRKLRVLMSADKSTDKMALLTLC